ncbi:CD209 antigen-like protein A [Anabas testudineus]|uniref:CD209 antigen-like protein A n=1 Tax=Anabas testudineus TaxID=64144 RepID=UPI000E463D28|nr:CD209 antigen-like protein A [Anabas testudineus]
MEEIYNNAEDDKSHYLRPSTDQTGSRSSERRLTVADFLCLGLLSVFLVIGLIGLGVHLASLTEERDQLKTSLTEMTEERNKLKTSLTEMTEERNKLKTSLTEMTEERNKLKTNLNELTEERDQLKTGLTEMTQEDNNLQSLCQTTCPDGWTKFCWSCYFLSTERGSWTKGREDCRTRGADLVVIHSAEEQTFFSTFINTRTWIGLNDRDNEGTWKWVDGTPLTVTNWAETQPDNGDGYIKVGEEDCVQLLDGHSSEWNDVSCAAPLPWICEKPAQP